MRFLILLLVMAPILAGGSSKNRSEAKPNVLLKEIGPRQTE